MVKKREAAVGERRAQASGLGARSDAHAPQKDLLATGTCPCCEHSETVCCKIPLREHSETVCPWHVQHVKLERWCVPSEEEIVSTRSARRVRRNERPARVA